MIDSEGLSGEMGVMVVGWVVVAVAALQNRSCR